MSEKNPTDWAKYLLWIEYAHNTLVSASTGLSPFEASLGYNPPLFPDEDSEILVPSVRDHMRRCRKVWTETREALEKAVTGSKKATD